MMTSDASAGSAFTRTHHHDFHPRFGLQRVKVIEIGNAGQGQAGDLDPARAGGTANVQRIFGGQTPGFGK